MKLKTSKHPPVLSIAEAAATLAVSQRTIHNWIASDLLPARKIGGVVRIRRSEVERLIGGAE
jgi:excisionase family DNA binding protein